MSKNNNHPAVLPKRLRSCGEKLLPFPVRTTRECVRQEFLRGEDAMLVHLAFGPRQVRRTDTKLRVTVCALARRSRV